MGAVDQVPGAPPRAGRREWLGLAVLMMPTLLISVDVTVLHLAVPELTASLRPTSTELLWIVDSYGFVLAGLLIPMGLMGDRIGRRRLLLFGAAGFAVMSVAAAFAPSAPMLIAARALLGVAGATLMPSTMSLLRVMFRDDRQRTAAVAAWSASFTVGTALGPLVGGALLEWFWWGAVFLLAVPVMAGLLLAGPVLLPEYRSPAAGSVDLAGVAMSFLAVLGVVGGVKLYAEQGAGWLPVALVAAGLALGAAFARRLRRAANPMIDVRLLRDRTFGTAVTVVTLSVFVLMGASLLTAQYLQLVLGLSPLRAGLWTVPQAVAQVAALAVMPALAARFRPGGVIAAGLALAAVGFAVLAAAGTDDLPTVVAASVIVYVGVAPVFSIGLDLVLAAAPPERAGAAAGLSETGTELGGALGIAVLGSIGTAVYRRQLVDTLPAGTPASLVDAARDTLGGALAAVRDLPEPIAGVVLEAARTAFVSGLRAAAVASALLAALLSALAAVALRRIRS